jgi:hypothetical protein
MGTEAAFGSAAAAVNDGDRDRARAVHTRGIIDETDDYHSVHWFVFWLPSPPKVRHVIWMVDRRVCFIPHH